MITIYLQWPESKLSSNQRIHFYESASAKKKYRSDCKIATIQQVKSIDIFQLKDKLSISLYFYPPTNHYYDLDNLIHRMKSGIDGISDALKINDKQFYRIKASRNEKKEMGMVGVVIEKINN